MQYGIKYSHKPLNKNKEFKNITLATFADLSSYQKESLKILQELEKEKKVVHGHNILCKRSLRKFKNLDDLDIYLNKKLSDVEGVYSWDALNECMGYLPNLGEDWYLYVLEKIRKSQPDCLLFWNEYALKNKNYWNSFMEKVKRASKEGLLDGVGIQRHIDLRGKLPFSSVTKPIYSSECFLKSWVNTKRLSYEIDRIHELNLLCHISEVSFKILKGQEISASTFLERLKKTCIDKNVYKLTYWNWPFIRY